MVKPKFPPAAEVTLEMAYDFFMLDGMARGFTAHTLRGYRGRLTLFLRWCDENSIIALESLDQYNLREYLAAMNEGGASAAYRHSTASSIRAFLK